MSNLDRLVAGLLIAIALSVACQRRDQDARERTAAGEFRPSYGVIMADIGRRFELVGRALATGRFELARYELDEIGEQFDENLPRAVPPREGHPEVLPGMVTAFAKTGAADLARALEAHDRSQGTAAFERTAQACNACHQASGHGFIEVPLVAGRAVPNTDPPAP